MIAPNLCNSSQNAGTTAPSGIFESEESEMEYEIGDDPQGLPDRAEGDREGGLRESVFFRHERKTERAAPGDDHARVEQFGELA